MKLKMAILLILLGCVIIVAGFLIGIKTLKPVEFIWYAAIVGAIAVVFGAFGNKMKEISSGKKSDEILENTRATLNNTDSTKSSTEELSKKLDQFIDETRLDGTLHFKDNQIDVDAASEISLKFGVTLGCPFGMINTFIPLTFDDGSAPISIGADGNELKLSCICYDLDGNWIVEIKNNYWRRNPNYSSKFNYDPLGFEIIDNKGNVAMSVDISRKNFIVIQGYICLRRQNYVFSFGHGMHSGEFKSAYNDPLYFEDIVKKAQITPLFLYDQEHYIGKRNPASAFIY